MLALALLLAAGAADEGIASLHFQATVATQWHPAFHAAYSGTNSLGPEGESATSLVMDLIGALRPWPGAEFTFQPQMAGGYGLSQTHGVAAFPSGEVYRVGNPAPRVVIARAFYKQEIGPVAITAGKYSIPDIFDLVPISNDPHTRFMSWGLFASGAYDYPADTRGYTWGLAAELTSGDWTARAGIFLEPKIANGIELEPDFTKSNGLVAEVERRWPKGAARLLGFFNTAPMGSYAAAAAQHVDISETREDGRHKGGFAASINEDFGAGLGGFTRVSWADGLNEAWAFTEIDRSLAFGVLQSGAPWGREKDEAGIALVGSLLSSDHRAYLAGGGLGFLIGDGALVRYGPEILGEIFYRAALTDMVALGVNYQPIINPAYNRDRGPAHVFTARAHVAF
jgi:high affinity Mn2+ porin